jgi:serine protease AprX
MAATRVVVFPMDDRERALVRRFLCHDQATDNVVYGDAPDSVLAIFRALNILYEEQPASSRARDDVLSLPSSTSIREGTCVIETQGPLTRERESELASLGVVVRDCVGTHRYSAVVRAPAVAAIRRVRWLLSLVSTQRPPSASRLRSSDEGVSARAGEDAIRVWDLYAHTEDRATLLGAVASVGATIDRPPEGSRLRVKATAAAVRELSVRFQWTYEQRMPTTFAMDHARVLSCIDSVQSATSAANSRHVTLDGGSTIVAVADSGLDSSHPAFERGGDSCVHKVVARNSDKRTSDEHGHGTHVASTIVGSGAGSPNNCYRGVAPGAKLFFQAIANNKNALDGLPLDCGELLSEAYQAGARVHNNSWCEHASARYTSIALDFDRFVFDHPDMVVIVAAGNGGTQRTTGFVSTEGDEPPVELGSVGAPATAKNVLTVGAQRSSRTDGVKARRTYADVMPERVFRGWLAGQLFSGDPNALAAFSARGPTDDDRIKPDLVAPGTSIAAAALLTAWKNTNCEGPAPRSRAYALMSGTSMATPIVSGAAALVRQYYIARREHRSPSAALVRATLINGARALTGEDALYEGGRLPNPNQGFGALDVACSLGIEPAVKVAFVDEWGAAARALSAGGVDDARWFSFELERDGPLRIALVYNDLPARAVPHVVDMHLRVPTGEKYFGNQQGAFVRARGAGDSKNNAKILRFAAAKAGRYVLRVVHYGFDRGAQTFALVVSGPLRDDALDEYQQRGEVF